MKKEIKNFNEYKQIKEKENAYLEASKIQETFALSLAAPIGSGDVKQYEGHIAVSDILAKIDAMTKMFENNLKNGTQQQSGEKIINIIDNLYDLAQIKMAEAKRQAREYMQKASGISLQPSVDSLESEEEDEEEMPPSPESRPMRPTVPRPAEDRFKSYGGAQSEEPETEREPEKKFRFSSPEEPEEKTNNTEY